MFTPYLERGGLFMLLFVPLMLLLPLLFVLCVPQRDREPGRIQAARRGLGLLVAGTAGVLLAWLLVLWLGSGEPWARRSASLAWAGFFPLWFGLAMPLLRLKHPAFGEIHAQGSTANLRSASLGNRERQSPITRRHWVLSALVFALATGAIAARGLRPFPLDTDAAAGVPSAVQPAAGAPAEYDTASGMQPADPERRRWLLTLLVYPLAVGISLLTVPSSIRRTLTEPEPLDGAGSPELRDLYRRQRDRRALGLYWGGALILPGCMGLLLALPLWWPAGGATWGLVGGIAGTLLGLAGAAFGVHTSLERARIQRVRARLEGRAPSA